MTKIKVEIHTTHSLEETVSRLKRHTHEKHSIIGSFKGFYMVGKIENNIIKTQILDSPPAEISGDIIPKQGLTSVNLIIKSEGLESSIKGLILGLCYPLLFVVSLLFLKDDPTNFWVYLLTILAIPIIYFAAKIFAFLEGSPIEPITIANSICKIIDGEIINKTN